MIQPASAVSQPGSADRVFAELVEELTAKLQAGEAVDIDALARKHPEHADRVRQLLPALEVLAELSRSGQASFPLAFDAASDAGPALRTLGDFRIVRELGRGGMGIVYEAEQVSLNRRVALKVLPFAATLDPRQLQRFKNEAQAAAQLHHTNIVPVFGVGSERGVHYYVMQFIEGHTLAALIGELRQQDRRAEPGAMSSAGPQVVTAAALTTERSLRSPAFFRMVAQLGVQAAEGLEHAHQLGVVHRDVKPANLLVDERGNLWITDFGLAHCQSQAGLTMTGDLVGTLRYMSPEQALAKRLLVDHRADVYSLGVSLYELLTLEPAFAGQDRQELLRQIAFEEPRPLRRVNRAIPEELEVITLRAMEENPPDRYATARELADDLRRFLENRTIRARRPTLVQRLRKLGQRHRRLLGVSVAFLLLMVVGLVVSVFLIWREKERTETALTQARANFAEAQTQRRRAESNFRQAFWTIEDLLGPLNPRLNSRPLTLAELRQWQIERSLRFLAPFCEDPSDDPAVRLQRGAAYVHSGRVYQVLGERAKTKEALQDAASIFDRLVEEFPEDPQYQGELAQVFLILAEECYGAGQGQEGSAYYSRALSIYREAIRSHPMNGGLHYQLADNLVMCPDPQLRNRVAAVRFARRAAELDPHCPTDVLGIACYRLGECQAATSALQASFGPEATPWRKARSSFFLAMVQRQSGQHAAALESYRKGVQFMDSELGLSLAPGLQASRAEAEQMLGIARQKNLPRPKEKESLPDKK
jgi:serine/threonine protein kinase